MATYIVLGKFTDQGIRNVKATGERANAAKQLAEKFGRTSGHYDLVLVVEAPDDKTMMALGMSFGKLGNVRTETLRAFSQAEIDPILVSVV